MRAVLAKYERVRNSLEEMAKTASKTASTASCLFEHFSKGKNVLGLTLAFECLNNVSGMQAAVECVPSSLRGKRNDESYLALYEKATTLIDSIVTHSGLFDGW
jgi:hypothetical protein